tara:strand:- start:1469 stop:1819 length:351 start_codon:yes stop_codon:yes gene_type:complete
MKDLNQSEYSEFAARFRIACKAIDIDHLPQDKVGKRLGVSGPMISNYRNGRKLPAMDTACRICSETGVSLEWLLLGRGAMTQGLSIDPLKDAWDAASVEQRLELMSDRIVRSSNSE